MREIGSVFRSMLKAFDVLIGVAMSCEAAAGSSGSIWLLGCGLPFSLLIMIGELDSPGLNFIGLPKSMGLPEARSSYSCCGDS